MTVAKNVFIETITPKMAAKWLEHSKFSQRPISPKHVKALATQMKEGKWKLNYETLKFGPQEEVVDGQHRLHAIVSSGVPVKMAVARDVDPEVFGSIDTGRRRNGSDVLAMRGEKNCSSLSGALRVVIIYEVLEIYDNHSGLVTNDDILQGLDEHPEIREWVDRAMHITGLIEVSIAAGFGYLFSRKSEKEAIEFFEQLQTGIELKQGSPVLLLRERLASNRSSLARLPRREVAALLVKAWNLFREKKTMKRLYWSAQEGEVFPRIR